MMLDIEDIKGSVRNPRLLDLSRDVKFFHDESGRVKFYAGGYAVVFPCEIDGVRKALRCWHTLIADSDERYKLIAESFTEAGFRFLVPFEYHVDSLMVGGRRYPFMITDWVDGKNIKDYVWENRNDGEALSALARRFLVMCAALDGSGISHGDLQHGNIIIQPDGRPRLIDYDSVWTGNMGTQSVDIVKGLAAYQHPGRRDNRYGFKGRDRFSQLVIYLSISAVMRDPSLAEKYGFADSEHMLFSASDYADWQHSSVRGELCNLHDADIDRLVTMMDCYLESDDVTTLPSFYLF